MTQPNGDLYEKDFHTRIDWLLSAINERRDLKKTSVTVVIGNKGAGKSRLNKYLVNRLLCRKVTPVFWLDTDVGQPELTPPGCLSLVQLDAPLVGIGFYPVIMHISYIGAAKSHQQSTFIESYYYGDVSPVASWPRYLLAIRKLMQSYRDQSAAGSALIVNTHGWLEEQGAVLMTEILKELSANFIFQLIDPYIKFHIDETCCEESWKVPAPSQANFPTNRPSASQQRDSLIVSYLGALLLAQHKNNNNHTTLSIESQLYELPPMAVRFSSIGIWLSHDCYVPDAQLLALLNASLVALCSVDETLLTRRIMDDNSMPYVVPSPMFDDAQLLQCYGFGVIRAIDIERRLFYVLTPVDRATLTRVNVFARSSTIDLPTCFLFSQDLSTPAPYVVRPHPVSYFHQELVVRSGHMRANRFKRQQKTTTITDKYVTSSLTGNCKRKRKYENV